MFTRVHTPEIIVLARLVQYRVFVYCALFEITKLFSSSSLPLGNCYLGANLCGVCHFGASVSVTLRARTHAQGSDHDFGASVSVTLRARAHAQGSDHGFVYFVGCVSLH